MGWIGKQRRRGTPRAWIMRQMRLPLIVASIVCSLAHAESGRELSPRPAAAARKPGLSIRVEPEGWGEASPQQIETVLNAVADELMAGFPERPLAPIVVSHTERNPIALYERGPGGEYRIRLHARGEKWHLYVYEFAHELCHILSNYDRNAGPQTVRYNQWFEETLCETASLFTLASLATTWERSPPAPRWAGEARNLRRFFEHLIGEGHRQLPPQAPLAAWLRDNEQALRENPYLRDKNDVVANLLLPLFSADPQHWEALAYLNLSPDDARNSLDDYLHHWYDNAPPEHKRFVGSVLALLWQREPPPEIADLAAATTVAAPLAANTGPDWR